MVQTSRREAVATRCWHGSCIQSSCRAVVSFAGNISLTFFVGNSHRRWLNHRVPDDVYLPALATAGLTFVCPLCGMALPGWPLNSGRFEHCDPRPTSYPLCLRMQLTELGDNCYEQNAAG